MNHIERIKLLLRGLRNTWESDPTRGEHAGRYLAYLVRGFERR